MSGIAQDELRKLSSRVKFGHAAGDQETMLSSATAAFSAIVKDSKRLVIDETEAPMVRELFDTVRHRPLQHEAD